MDIRQNNKKNPIKEQEKMNSSPKSPEKQHKMIYNLMSSVKESENLANSVNSKLYDQNSPKTNQKPKNLNETLSPVNSSPSGPLKSSMKLQSSIRVQYEKDLTLSSIFKKDDMAQMKFADVKESVLLKQSNALQEPQSSLSSHINSAQKSSLKRLIFLSNINYKKLLAKTKMKRKVRKVLKVKAFLYFFLLKYELLVRISFKDQEMDKICENSPLNKEDDQNYDESLIFL